MSSEKARRVRLLFLQLTTRSGVWQTAAVFCNCAFFQAGLSYSSNQRLVYLGAASAQRQAGREKAACSAPPRCPEAKLQGPRRASPEASSCARRSAARFTSPNQPLSEGKWEF